MYCYLGTLQSSAEGDRRVDVHELFEGPCAVLVSLSTLRLAPVFHSGVLPHVLAVCRKTLKPSHDANTYMAIHKMSMAVFQDGTTSAGSGASHREWVGTI